MTEENWLEEAWQKSKELEVLKKNDAQRFSYNDRNTTKNKRGEWVPNIPLPYFGFFKKGCSCGASFYTMDGYAGHYALKHILGL